MRVDATLLEGQDKSAAARSIPGAFWYWQDAEEKLSGIIHSCPCGCGMLSNLYLSGVDHPRWVNSGTRERPTLSPSVLIRDPYESHREHWHGYLRNGVWESV